MKTGGISQATEIAALARRFNRACMIGCMLESHVSVTAAAHFALAHADVVRYVDLDGPQLCRESLVEGGLQMDGPWIVLNDAPGLGIREVRGLQNIQTYGV
jgi:L-alanine-DL-glutamate epimerase-like enolase superfamily enzyme